MSGAATAGGRYAHIDALRAAAVMLVVVAHAGAGEVVPGGSGVTIFFSISGFIITYLVLRERERTGRFAIGSFYVRRAMKILPPFAVIVLIPTAVYAAFRHVDLDGVLSQILFFYNWTIITVPPEVLPGSRVVWSLSVEEQFYVVFALLWFFASRRRDAERWLIWTAVAAIAYSEITKIRLAADALANEQRIEYGSDTRMDGIALGVLCAVLFVRWSRGSQELAWLRRALSSQWTLPAAGAIYLFTLAFRDDTFRATARFPLQSIAACMVILFGFLAADGWARRPFDRAVRLRAVQAIGLASYSIYLAHFSLDRALLGAVDDLPLPLQVVLLSLAGVAVGLVVYRLVEVPFARLRAQRHAPGDPGADMTEASAGRGVAP
jgi:peptidoglycan/LPS O-acetylase OafA/YrhL